MTRISSVAIVAIGLALASCDKAAPVLSAAAEIACSGQKCANAATEAATRLGKTEAAALSSQVSAALGFACLW